MTYFYFNKKHTFALAFFVAFFTFSFGQAPVNDSLCQAIMLTVNGGCNGTTNGDNTGATSEDGEPLPECFEQGPNSVWYSFVAPASGKVTITTFSEIQGTNDDTEIALYELLGNDCTQMDSLLELGCHQDISPFGPYLSTIPNAIVNPGQMYYVQVSGWNGTEGSFCIEVLGPPSNDSICNAKELMIGVACEEFVENNSGAGLEEGEPIPGCFSPNNNATVWYTFTGPQSGYVSLSTEFANASGNALTDTEIALYWAPNGGCGLDSLVLISCSQDDGVDSDLLFQSNIFIAPAPAGERFYVQVSGWDGAIGSFCIEANALPAPEPTVHSNDLLCNAIDITMGDTCTIGDNTNAFFEIGEPYPGCFITPGLRSPILRSVWYKFVAPPSGIVEIRTDLGDSSQVTLTNTSLAMYQLANDDCSNPQNLSLVSCERGGGRELFPDNAVIVSDSLSPGETYYLQVSGEDQSGTFCIQVIESERPINDLPCNAFELPIDGLARNFNNILGTVDAGEQSIAPPLGESCNTFENWCLDDTILSSVWFKFTAPPSGSVTISTCDETSDPSFDPHIALYSADDCNDYGTFKFLAANDDDASCGFEGLGFMATIPPVTCLIPGNTYYILVDGYTGSQGFFTLSITESKVEAISTTVDAYCPGGAGSFLDLSVSGGIAPYTYQWDNGEETEDLADISAGIYEVVVTDFCGSTDTLTTEITGSMVTLQVEAGMDDAICLGDELTLGGAPTASSGLPFQPENGFALDAFNERFSRHDLNRPDTTVVISEEDYAEKFYSGGDFSPNGFYAFETNDNLLVKIDTITGRQQVISEAAAVSNHTWTGLAWDQSSMQMYATSSNGSESILYTVDLAVGTIETIASLEGVPLANWLAIDNNGNAFTMNTRTDTLYSVNLTTGQTAEIGHIGFDANFFQDADFDPRTNLLYLAALNVDNPDQPRAELRVALIATGETVKVQDFGDGVGQITAFGVSKHRFVDHYIYEWTPSSTLLSTETSNPVAMPGQAETYYLTVSDACGTTIMDSVSIDVSNMSLEFTNTTDDGTGNGTASVSVENGIEPYAYEWSTGDTINMISGIAAGEYAVTVTDAIGCKITDSTAVFVTSIGDLLDAGLAHFEIFPNPNNGKFLLKAGLKDRSQVRAKLYDSKGQIILQKDFGSTMNIEEEIHLPRIAEGIYVLQVLTEKGSVYKRLVIQ